MYVPREFHDLHTGDRFAFEQDGPVYTVNDGEYIDYWGNRMVFYPATDGLHAHLANHDLVWVLI